MKTAEKLAQSIALYKDNKDFIEFINTVLLEGWKQGMSDAADIAFKVGQETSSPIQEHYHTATQAITTARDNKTTI